MLNQSTIWKLRQMQAEIRRLMQEGGASSGEDFSPAHYLVKAPSGGIPAADGTTPGEATCTIVTRYGSGTKVLTDSTQAVKVYNPFQEIPEGARVVVHQDSWGDWYVSDSTASQVLIKAPSGGIPQRVGTLLGSATCDVYAASSSGVISDTTENITVWNWGTTAACANGDRYGWAEYRHPIWYVVSEDCGDEGGQVSASLSLSPADTGESTDFSTTSAASLFVTPKTVNYTPPVGVVPV